MKYYNLKMIQECSEFFGALFFQTINMTTGKCLFEIAVSVSFMQVLFYEDTFPKSLSLEKMLSKKEWSNLSKSFSKTGQAYS